MDTALLHRALMQLPAEKREVLLLSRFQEMKYEDIARTLECEVGTVKVRVHRALRELRDRFEKLSAIKPKGAPQTGVPLPFPNREKGNLS